MADWCCFHCDEVFTDERAARAHFGADEEAVPACRLKASEGGLLAALRRAEDDAANAWMKIHTETTDAARAYHAQHARHLEQLRIVEEAAYERGLADGRLLAIGDGNG